MRNYLTLLLAVLSISSAASAMDMTVHRAYFAKPQIETTEDVTVTVDGASDHWSAFTHYNSQYGHSWIMGRPDHPSQPLGSSIPLGFTDCF